MPVTKRRVTAAFPFSRNMLTSLTDSSNPPRTRARTRAELCCVSFCETSDLFRAFVPSSAPFSLSDRPPSPICSISHPTNYAKNPPSPLPSSEPPGLHPEHDSTCRTKRDVLTSMFRRDERTERVIAESHQYQWRD